MFLKCPYRYILLFGRYRNLGNITLSKGILNVAHVTPVGDTKILVVSMLFAGLVMLCQFTPSMEPS